MAENTLKTRIVLNNKTSSEWASTDNSSKVPLKGEVCIYSDLNKIKIGNGTSTITDLTFANLTPEEVQSLIQAASHSHSNKTILDATTASFTTELLTKLNGIATGATKVTVDSSLSSTSTNPVQNKVINSALNGKVSTSRTVNGKALSANITLSASDVGADASGSATNALNSAKSYSDTNLATAKSYTDQKVAALVGTAPETMDTLEEVAAAIEAHKDVTDALNSAIGNKVDKVSGKGLSTNDLTNTLKSNYDKAYTHSQATHAPSNAERNTVVGIQKNGTDLTPDSSTRKVNITVPTKTSEITNDSGFLTSSGTISKANQLTNIRTIDGMNFNGTANIHHFAECSTAAGTAAKTVTLSGFVLATGARITVKFTVTNTAASPTLNVNSTGAKSIMYRGSAISAGYLAANRVYEFIYDGTDWELIGDLDTNSTYGAAGSSLGLVKTGGDVTISNGVVTVNDDSHNHVISNIDGLQSALDGKANSSHGTHVTYSSDAPAANGTASAGSATTVSRSDHVHPLQTSVSGSSGSCTGNAGSATKLQTARNFSITGGATAAAVSFQGTGNVALNVTSLNAMNLNVGTSDVLILDGNF